MSTKRKSHSARFKAKVALEAYKGDKTAAELISAHKISSGQVSTWKSLLKYWSKYWGPLYSSALSQARNEEIN
jgi:transposase-like protein